MTCPLCEDKEIKIIEKVNKKDLLYLYQKITNEDFSYLIDRDIDYCECKSCTLRFYYPLITGDEKFYNSLQKYNWYYLDEKDEFSYAKKYIKNSDLVLEVGSGKGAFAKYLSAKNYIGLDFSKNAKKLAAENGVLVENEMIQEYSKKHKSEFDVVISFQVLEHVTDPKSFIEANIEALKSGGKLIIAVPSEDSFLKYVTNGILNMPPHHVTRWSDETFHFIANKYNLTIENIYHESLQDVHKKWYLHTLICNSLYGNKLISLSIWQVILNIFSSVFSRLLISGLKDEMLPKGHTVLVVLEKK